NRLTLAYCMSIHKSQGSEFKMVILPMVGQYNRMLQRNLLYTAVTRAADMLILLGEPNAFAACVTNLSVNRHTTLTMRIQGVLAPDQQPQPAAAETATPTSEAQPVKDEKTMAATSDATQTPSSTATTPDEPANYRLTPALVLGRK